MVEIPSATELKERMEQSSVAALYVYPIKSCAGIAVEAAEVVSTGFKHDRELMLIYPDGQFITQRKTKNPDHKERANDPTNKLATIRPGFLNGDLVRVDAPGMPELYVEVKRKGVIIETAVHRQTGVKVVSQGKDARKWFSEYLGFDCLLVAKEANYVRQVDLNWAEEGDQTLFPDGFSFLVASVESLDDLNERREAKGLYEVSINQFRPNILIRGSGVPYGEDYLRKIRIGDVEFDIEKPCARCEITGVDQETGYRTNPTTAPLATLSKYRRGKNALGEDGAFLFQNATHRNLGRVSVFDKVEVIEIDDKPNFIPDH